MLLASESIFAQLAKSSWGLGFGGTYPRYTNSNISGTEYNYGGYLSIQRNLTEHSAVRFAGRYVMLEAEYGTPTQKSQTSVISGQFDFLYSFVPCEPVSPYILAGVGGMYYMLDNPPDITIDDSGLEYVVTFGFGANWKVGDAWDVKTELYYNTASGSMIDGAPGSSPTGGILGANYDAYMSFDVGLVYYFGKGEESKICQLYEGIKLDEMPDPVDYERIENIVKKNIPREVVKEVVVEKPVSRGMDNMVLVGVNFEFNSTKLQPEAYPIVFHATQVLLSNPDMNVEIQGHTDNIGSEKYNQSLSEKRAQTVKNYLVSKGVDASRLTVVGYGETKPMADNKTADGRAMNRRIEFKVK